MDPCACLVFTCRPWALFLSLDSYSGGSADWAKGVAGIKYTFTVELRDRGHFGFLLPTQYIVPVGRELWAGVQVVARQVINETCTESGIDPFSSAATTAPYSTIYEHMIKYCLHFCITLTLVLSV